LEPPDVCHSAGGFIAGIVINLTIQIVRDDKESLMREQLRRCSRDRWTICQPLRGGWSEGRERERGMK